MDNSDISNLRNQINQIFNNKIEVLEAKTHIDTSQIPKSNTVYVVKCSVMFVDMRNSTKLTSTIGMENITKVYKALSRIITKSVNDNNGYIEQIQGDGYLCTFYDTETLASGGNAINAALNVLTYIDQAYNVCVEPDMKIQCGIGITTGHIYVAKLGAKGKNNPHAPAFPSIITNTSSKMCGAADGGEILFDDKTYHEIKDNSLKQFAKQISKKEIGLCKSFKGIVWRIEQ